MKKLFSLFLTFIMLLSLLCGCQTAPADDTTASTQGETQSAEEQAVLKVLTIGNSHSLDATNLLYEVFQKESPEQKVVLGVMYYGGTRMEQHHDFVSNEKAEYYYYKTTEDGIWKELYPSTLQMALQDDVWDIVILQEMNTNLGLESSFVAEHYMTVINCVKKYQKATPQFWFHMPWANPDDYTTYLNDDAPYSIAAMFQKSAAGWRTSHEEKFPDANGKFDHKIMYKALTDNVQKYLVDSTAFLGKNYFADIITSGTAIEYAQDILGLSQQELYRDYTHLNDYGRLMVAYLWYAKLMNLNSIDAVNVSQIPGRLHHSTSIHPNMPLLEITEDMKQDIIASVNWTLSNPYQVTAE